MDVREKLVELLRNAKAAMKSENLSCDIARNMFVVDFMIANGVTVQEWISVDDRLPENIANRVLVVCERSNGVFYAHYEKPFWINLETDKPFISTVTHWMLLPELPKGDNDAESVD